MRNRKALISGMAIFLVVIMVVSLLVGVIGRPRAYAVTQSQIDALEEKKDALSDEKAGIQAEIDSLETQKASILEQKAALDERNELSRQEIAVLTEQIALYDDMIEQKGIELEDALAQEQEQYERLRVRIRAMEEDGDITYLSILFNSSDFSELLSRMDMIEEIMEYDKRLEEDYIATRQEVERLKAEYEKAQDEMEEKKADLQEEVEQLEQQIKEAEDMIADLEDDIGAYTQAYNENEQAEQQLQSEIDALISELRRQEEAAAASNPTGGSTIASTGSYTWPVPSSTYITSGFGYRIHPIFGTQRYHNGVDIAANSGVPILAADSGTVSVATYSSSYGNYVLINHGNGNTTLYAHMSSMAVSAGQSVTKGQTIGYVGSTGWSTGPHCHFEIRSNGALVDPLSYFSSYTLAPDA